MQHRGRGHMCAIVCVWVSALDRDGYRVFASTVVVVLMTVYLTSYDGCSTLQGWPNVTWHVAQTLRLPQNFSGVKFCSWAIFNNKKSFLLLLPLMTIGQKLAITVILGYCAALIVIQAEKRRNERKKEFGDLLGLGGGWHSTWRCQGWGTKLHPFNETINQMQKDHVHSYVTVC